MGVSAGGGPCFPDDRRHSDHSGQLRKLHRRRLSGHGLRDLQVHALDNLLCHRHGRVPAVRRQAVARRQDPHTVDRFVPGLHRVLGGHELLYRNLAVVRVGRRHRPFGRLLLHGFCAHHHHQLVREELRLRSGPGHHHFCRGHRHPQPRACSPHRGRGLAHRLSAGRVDLVRVGSAVHPVRHPLPAL